MEGGRVRPRETVASLLKRLRAASGLSQEALAERAGLSVKAVSALEQGTRRRPHPQTLRALSFGLGLSAEGRALLLSVAAGQATPFRGPPPVAQLPRDVSDFTDRTAEVATAMRAL